MLTVDELIRHRIDMERYSQGLSRKAASEINSLADDVFSILSGLPDSNTGIRSALSEIDSLIASTFDDLQIELLEEFREFLLMELKFLSSREDVELTEEEENNLILFLLPSLILGQTFQQHIRQIRDNTIRKIRAMALAGRDDNNTSGDIAKGIRGTEARGFKDGVWNTVLNGLNATINTALTTYTNKAHLEVWNKFNKLPNEEFVRRYRWISVLDSRTTAICRARSNKVYIMGEGPIPPAHPNCFSEDTEVLTRDGWIPWPDVKGDELFLSVDLETGNCDYVKSLKLVKYEYKGLMDRFTNGYVDILTTPNHTHVVKFRVKQKGRKDAGVWKLVSGEGLPGHDYNFLATIPNYIGREEERLFFDGHEVSSLDFMCFLGVYLSEGSIFKSSKNKFAISIHQEKYYDEMLNVCKSCFRDRVKSYKNSSKIVINGLSPDSDLVKLLYPLGHSYNKSIPDYYKGYDKQHLENFLHWFALGDGSHTKVGSIFGYKNNIYRSFSTSSNKLASDISELILKVGKRPSFSVYTPKTVKHYNGVYTSNYPQWHIRECISGSYNRDRMTVAKEHYEGFVYDVELEKWHTLVVRRCGRVFISGNCRSSIKRFVDGEVIPESYDEWLRAQPNDVQEDVLGKAKANFFREHPNVKLDKYITKAGRELTIADLRKRYNN